MSCCSLWSRLLQIWGWPSLRQSTLCCKLQPGPSQVTYMYGLAAAAGDLPSGASDTSLCLLAALQTGTGRTACSVCDPARSGY